MTGSNAATSSGTNSGLLVLLGDVRAGGARSLGRHIADGLRRAVRDGRLPAGTVLPASRRLAADLGVSRGVVVRAYEQLVAEGYLTARTGQGTRVGDVHAVAGRASPATDRVVPASPGVPALGWFPRRAWLRAIEAALAELPDADLGYGDPRGHPRLRRVLAAHLARTRAVVAPPDQIVVTGGFAQAIRLVGEALAHHGVHTVGVEDPGSVGVTDTLRAAGVRTRPVPVDDDSLDVALLAATDLAAVAVTPAHQFPTGAVLAPDRRAALLDWTRERRAVVVEDDYDAEYRYDRAPVGALQGLSPDRVVYGGSVSKSLAPGVRLAWVVAPPWLAGTLADVKMRADIDAPVIEQAALAAFIDSGALDRHVRRTAARYAARRDRLVAAAARHLPAWRVAGIAAGLHAVLVPPAPVPAEVLDAAASAAADLLAVPLAAFAQGGEPRSGLVVGYGSATPDQIGRGVDAMATAVGARTRARSTRR